MIFLFFSSLDKGSLEVGVRDYFFLLNLSLRDSSVPMAIFFHLHVLHVKTYHFGFFLVVVTISLQSLQKKDTSHLSGLKVFLFSNSSIFIKSQKLDMVFLLYFKIDSLLLLLYVVFQ